MKWKKWKYKGLKFLIKTAFLRIRKNLGLPLNDQVKAERKEDT